jgi:hypothetical protein
VEYGNALESAEVRDALSKTKYRDQSLSEENNRTYESYSSNSACRLDRLQRTNFFLTSVPCPHVSLPVTEAPILFHPRDGSHGLSQDETGPKASPNNKDEPNLM